MASSRCSASPHTLTARLLAGMAQIFFEKLMASPDIGKYDKSSFSLTSHGTLSFDRAIEHAAALARQVAQWGAVGNQRAYATLARAAATVDPANAWQVSGSSPLGGYKRCTPRSALSPCRRA